MTTPTQTVETFLDALARRGVDAAMALIDSQVDAYWCQAQLYRRLAVERYDEIGVLA